MFIVFNWVFLFEAYEATSISLATVVYHTQPFFLVLLGAVFLRERISAGKLGWLALAFAGLVLVSGVRPGETASLKGLGFALAAAVLYALATFVTKRITGVRPHLIALVQVLTGLPLLLPFADFGAVGGLGTGWLWLVGLGIVHTGLMYVLMYAAYAKLPTAKIAVLAFTYPAVAMGVDWAVYGHHIGLVQALGVPLIVLASLKVTLSGSAPARVVAPAPRTAGHEPEAASPPPRELREQGERRLPVQRDERPGRQLRRDGDPGQQSDPEPRGHPALGRLDRAELHERRRPLPQLRLEEVAVRAARLGPHQPRPRQVGGGQARPADQGMVRARHQGQWFGRQHLRLQALVLGVRFHQEAHVVRALPQCLPGLVAERGPQRQPHRRVAVVEVLQERRQPVGGEGLHRADGDRPRGSAALATAVRASSASSPIRRAYGRRRSPASVSRMRLPRRSKSSTPSEDSRERIWPVTLDCA